MTAVALFSDEAEERVIGTLLNEPNKTAEVVSQGLLPEHFFRAQNRLLYETIVESFYGDAPVDPLTIGTRLAPKIAQAMSTAPEQANKHVQALAEEHAGAEVRNHVALIRERADARRVVALANKMRKAIEDGDPPAEVAGRASSAALRIVTSDDAAGEIVSVEDAGRAFILHMREAKARFEAGYSVGCRFNVPAFDDYTHGLQPTELLILGGEPGVGKSGVAWRAGMNFAERALHEWSYQPRTGEPDDKPMGTLILSLEMGRTPSNMRVTQAWAEIKGEKLRAGDVSEEDMTAITEAWRGRLKLPLWFNYAPSLRASQLRALISEAIRRHNVGLVVIDHFRTFDLDRRLQNRNDEDEEKVRFLKENLAGDLNIAVICLAHTRKKDSVASDPRPKLSDLRGSGQIAALSDFVCFLHRPFKYATEDEREAGDVQPTDAELIWEKNRHGIEGTRKFFFDPATMRVV